MRHALAPIVALLLFSFAVTPAWAEPTPWAISVTHDGVLLVNETFTVWVQGPAETNATVNITGQGLVRRFAAPLPDGIAVFEIAMERAGTFILAVEHNNTEVASTTLEVLAESPYANEMSALRDAYLSALQALNNAVFAATLQAAAFIVVSLLVLLIIVIVRLKRTKPDKNESAIATWLREARR